MKIMIMMMMGSKGGWELGQATIEPRFCDLDRGTNEPHKRVGHVTPRLRTLRQHLDADISTSDAIPILPRNLRLEDSYDFRMQLNSVTSHTPRGPSYFL